MSLTPRVWNKFSRKYKEKDVEFCIQEAHSDLYSKVWDLLNDFFVPEELIHKASGLSKNNQALDEYAERYMKHFTISEQCQVDACCIKNDAGELIVVAASIMYIERKSDPTWDGLKILSELQTVEMKKFIEMVNYMFDVYYRDYRNNLDYEAVYDDVGVVVHNDYRGLGIAGEMFKARELTCKEYNIPIVGAWMTSIASQKAVNKLGWETVIELNYKELENLYSVVIEDTPPTAKYMIKKVNTQPTK